MHYSYRTSGVCAINVSFDIENGNLYNVKFLGGCDGNLKAIGKLTEGRNALETADLLEGNTCGWKKTSCADQLSKAIRKALDSVNA